MHRFLKIGVKPEPKPLVKDQYGCKITLEELELNADQAAIEMLESATRIEELEWELHNARLEQKDRQKQFNRAKVAQLKEKHAASKDKQA